ncbi:MAG: DUF1552 domain-containing protein [Bdellovibrionales bacterium]|nr:DUF1552 domain-containing protein [Bdellovibrionales bacterium]
MSRKKGLNRRDFMKMLGNASIYLPVLPSLMSSRSLAQASNPPLRMVFIMNRNGQWDNNFYPNVSPAQVGSNIYQAPLSDVNGSISPLFGTAYDSLKNKVSILRGLDVVGSNDHNRCSFLCGVTQGGATNREGSNPPFGASIDWIIEKSAQFYSTAPRIRTMRFSNGGGRGFSFSNNGGAINGLTYWGSDASFFNNVFAGIENGGTVPTVDLVARKSFLIEKSLERLNLMKTQTRLSGLDVQRISDQQDRLSDIRKGLVVTAPASCQVPKLSFMGSSDPIRKKYENINNSIVAAFTCDISRIACVYIEDYDDKQTDYSYFHDLSHRDRSAANLKESADRNGWTADRVAHLIHGLDSTIDTNGRPMLENTLVFWGSEISVKQGTESHRGESMPIMVAGWPAQFRMGSYVDYRTRPFSYVANRQDFPATGRPYTQFLCSIMLAAGLDPSEFTGYGKGGYFGEFERTQYNPNEYDAYKTTRNDKLPYFVL